jgi:hypothetical protein
MMPSKVTLSTGCNQKSLGEKIARSVSMEIIVGANCDDAMEIMRVQSEYTDSHTKKQHHSDVFARVYQYK